LWGRALTLVTDNQPIIRHIFAHDKSSPIVASYHLQHWAAILSGFNYRLDHRKTYFLSVADALSRLPTNVNVLELSSASIPVDLPLGVEAVMDATLADPILSRVLEFNLEGRPNKLIDPALALYHKLRFYFSIEKACYCLPIE